MEMIDYIREQPLVYQKVLADRKKIAEGFVSVFTAEKPDHIYLISSGTSRNAASAAALFMQEILGMDVTVMAASVADGFMGKHPLAIYISQGGNSTNTIAALARHPDGPSIAFTGNPKGVINTLADHYIEIPCGEETAGPKTKGYTITILSLYLMALEAALESGKLQSSEYAECISALEAAGNMMADNINAAVSWTEVNKERLKTLRQVYAIGGGISKIVAEEGALKLMETFLIPAYGFEFEEFLHGPACSINPGVSGFYLLPEKVSHDYARMCSLAEYHRGYSETVFLIGTEASDDKRDFAIQRTGKWYTAPFEEILLLQAVSAIIPGLLNIAEIGMNRFKQLDSILKMKEKGDPS